MCHFASLCYKEFEQLNFSLFCSAENYIFDPENSENPNNQSMNKNLIPMIAVSILLSACGGGQKPTQKDKSTPNFTGAKGEVKLMTLDPGHFHAALVQKSMYEQIDPTVYVYAPEGEDVIQHLGRIDAFNKRTDNPTAWVEKVYTGTEYLEKMLAEKPGNVMMVAGNNAKKTEYIQKAVEAGLNVFADKPMVITPEGFPLIEQAFQTAEEKGVLLYDIMTERHEITSIIQRELANNEEIFGGLIDGTPEQPAVTKESVHHFSKMVAGSALKRPAWFFDTAQQGEGIVDVTTHLVDLVQWGCFPEVTLNKSDVQMLTAKRWTTAISPVQFEKVTGMKEYPEFLKKDVAEGQLNVYSNGEMVYKLKGKVAKVSVIWNFEAPAGTGDTHFSIMRGDRCNVMIKQGKEENYKPTVYIEANAACDLMAFEPNLKKAVEQKIAAKYVGLRLNKLSDRLWSVEVPAQYSVGHEAHFGQVTEKFLQYLKDGKLPEWEVPNMIVKYYTTTEAMKLAQK